MPTPATIKTTHKAVENYYAALKAYAEQGVAHEGAVRSAFQNLLDETGRRFGWTLIPEFSLPVNGRTIEPDGTFRDQYHVRPGYWEAKDTKDHLETQIKNKIRKWYPLTNTIFEDTSQAYLYQNGRQAMKVDLSEPRQLADLLNAFFAYTEPAHENLNEATEESQQGATKPSSLAESIQFLGIQQHCTDL